MARQPEPQPHSQSQVHYDEEMDWSPSASQHRAFSTYNPYKVRNTNPRFSDTPIEPKAGPIWYKVPPAPTTPAQRLRNPPLKPIIRESPKDNNGLESIFQKKNPGRQQQQQQRTGDNSICNTPPPSQSQSFSQSQSDLTFAEPRFYAPEPQDDPRDGLTRMFASSFSISPGPDDEAMRRSRSGGGVSSFVSKLTGAGAGAGSRQQRGRRSRAPRIAEFVVLLGALAAWLRAPSMPRDGVVVGTGAGAGFGGALHGSGLGLPVAIASLGACLLVSVRLAADLLVDEQLELEQKQQQELLRRRGNNSGGKPKPDSLVPRRSVLAPSCANLACLQVLAALVLMWTVWSGQAGAAGAGAGTAYYGNALFGVVVAHQTWHVFS